MRAVALRDRTRCNRPAPHGAEMARHRPIAASPIFGIQMTQLALSAVAKGVMAGLRAVQTLSAPL